MCILFNFECSLITYITSLLSFSSGQFRPFVGLPSSSAAASASGAVRAASVSALTEVGTQRLMVGSSDGQIVMMSVCHSEYKKGF
jgi:hypothetical protein